MAEANITGAATHNAVQTGAALPRQLAPSVLRQYQLSMVDQPFQLPASDDCLCDSSLREMYSAYRTFGTPAMLKATQGQGDVAPVQRALAAPRVAGAVPVTSEFMNFQPLQAAVDGRAATCGAPGNFRDDVLGGFSPSYNFGVTAALPRPEHVLQTVSVGLSCPKGGEMLNPRPFVPLTQPGNMNLVPVSESQATRAENACRLNRMQDRLVALRMGAAGM